MKKKPIWSLMLLIICISSVVALLIIKVDNKIENNIEAVGSDDIINTIYEITIILDPGHGKEDDGAVCNYDGVDVCEKDLDLKIAYMLKKELESYKTQSKNSVKVILTRENDEYNPKYKDRVILGVENNADLVISLHNNANVDKVSQFSGAMVLATNSHFCPKNSKFNSSFEIQEAIGNSILKELSRLGINMTNGDCVSRMFDDEGAKYPNGDVADWHAMITYGVRLGIPTIIVEHAYLDNETDFREFLSSDEKLKKIAVADARGIANYYNLIKTDTNS